MYVKGGSDMPRLIEEITKRPQWVMVNGVPTKIVDNERNKRIDSLVAEVYEPSLEAKNLGARL